MGGGGGVGRGTKYPRWLWKFHNFLLMYKGTLYQAPAIWYNNWLVTRCFHGNAILTVRFSHMGMFLNLWLRISEFILVTLIFLQLFNSYLLVLSDFKPIGTVFCTFRNIEKSKMAVPRWTWTWKGNTLAYTIYSGSLAPLSSMLLEFRRGHCIRSRASQILTRKHYKGKLHHIHTFSQLPYRNSSL